MESQKEITRAETVRSALLWYAILAPPLVWAAQLMLDYGLDEGLACTPGARVKGVIFGAGIETVIQVTNAVATILTALAFVVAYRCYVKLRGADATVAQRARWMAIAGMFNGSLFIIITALKFASPVFLDACTSPL